MGINFTSWLRAGTMASIAAGGLWAVSPRQAPSALATLYFPPPQTTDGRGPEPRDWACSRLSSTELGERVRRTLRSSASPNTLAAASLLVSEGHLSFHTREPGLLSIRVTGTTLQHPLELCQAVVLVLEEDLLLERERRVAARLAGLLQSQARALEREERAEKETYRELRDFKKSHPETESGVSPLARRPLAEPMDLTYCDDFQAGLLASRRLRSEELHVNLQEEADLPGFSVTEPPYLETSHQPKVGVSPAACLGVLIYLAMCKWQRTTRG